MSNPEHFVVDAADRQNPLWQRLERHLKQRIESLRLQNEQDADERKTANLRGQIRALRSLLGAAKDTPITED